MFCQGHVNALIKAGTDYVVLRLRKRHVDHRMRSVTPSLQSGLEARTGKPRGNMAEKREVFDEESTRSEAFRYTFHGHFDSLDEFVSTLGNVDPIYDLENTGGEGAECPTEG